MNWSIAFSRVSATAVRLYGLCVGITGLMLGSLWIYGAALDWGGLSMDIGGILFVLGLVDLASILGRQSSEREEQFSLAVAFITSFLLTLCFLVVLVLISTGAV